MAEREEKKAAAQAEKAARERYQAAVEQMRDRPEFQTPRIDNEPTQAQISVTIDRERASDLGIDIGAIGTSLQALLEGRSVTDVFVDGNSIPVRLVSSTTPINDPTETLAVRATFGGHADKLVMSSTKSMTGHLLGAAGGLEAGITALAVRHQVAPPTINLDNPSVETKLDLVAHKAKPMKIEVALSNSFGFGGTNASVVFKKVA